MADEQKTAATLAKQAWGDAAKDNVGLLAAGVAFYGFLAFVPLIAATVLLYGLVADPATVAQHAESLGDVLPSAAAEIINNQLRSIVEADQGRTGFGFVLALLVAIYSAAKGAKAIIIALNIVHGVEETRGFIGQTKTALLITAALVATAIAAILAIGLLGYIESLLPGLGEPGLTLLRVAFWAAAGFLAACGLALIYRYGPHRDGRDWKKLVPGALTATLLWLIATLGFGIYVANFGSYNATYGALGAVVVMLMWLYLSAYVLLLGAELNAARLSEYDS
jgi:membrane protein